MFCVFCIVFVVLCVGLYVFVFVDCVLWFLFFNLCLIRGSDFACVFHVFWLCLFSCDLFLLVVSLCFVCVVCCVVFWFVCFW